MDADVTRVLAKSCEQSPPDHTETPFTSICIASSRAYAVSVADETGAFEYAGSSPNALFATRRNIVNPAFHRMVRDLVRFNNDAKRLVGAGETEHELSLRQFLDAGGYSKYFIERLIVPQAVP